MIHIWLVAAFLTTHLTAELPAEMAGLSPLGRIGLWLLPPTLLVAVFALRAKRSLRNLDELGDVSAALRTFRAAGRCRAGVVGLHALATFAVQPLLLIREAVGDLIVIDELLATLPVLAAFAGIWWWLHPISQRLSEASLLGRLDRGEDLPRLFGRGAFVWLHIRQEMLFILLPVVLLLALGELAVRLGDALQRAGSGARAESSTVLDSVASRFPAWAQTDPGTTGVALSLLAGGTILVMGLFPLALRWLWDTQALEDGPLLDRVRATLSRFGVHVSSVRIWHTQGGPGGWGGANAAVVGLFWPLRDLLLTDKLVEALPAVEIEAVIAHEATHLRQHHAFWLALAVLGAGSTAGLLVAKFSPQAGPGIGEVAAALAGIVSAILAAIFISRRFEWQADAHAARFVASQSMAGPEVMASALRRVAKLNGVPLKKPSLRHGSIALRCRRLEQQAMDDKHRRSIDRAVWALRAIILLSVLAAGALAFAGGGAMQT